MPVPAVAAPAVEMADMSIREALEAAVQRLAPLQTSARLDAELLLSHALGKPRHRPYVWPEEAIGQDDFERFQALTRRRAAGEPVAYLTGHREFWSLDLLVTPATLIPRPETECVVEAVLVHLPTRHRARIADLGTGSGAIALALASERPRCEVVATDCSGEALAVARENAHRLGLNNVNFRQGDWCLALPDQRFDCIAANPPYIAQADPHLERGDVQFEPRAALAAGTDGLEAIRIIARDAGDYLTPGGRLILEHGCEQGATVRELLRAKHFDQIETHRDLAGHDRVTEARRAG